MSKQDLINQLNELRKTIAGFDSSKAKARDWAVLADACMEFQENIGDCLGDLDKADKEAVL